MLAGIAGVCGWRYCGEVRALAGVRGHWKVQGVRFRAVLYCGKLVATSEIAYIIDKDCCMVGVNIGLGPCEYCVLGCSTPCS